MRVVHALPPLFDEIDAVFGVRGKEVFFAFGDAIYNPAGILIPPHIIAHEEEHGRRQRAYPGGADAWWRKYLADAQFRFVEEFHAHVVEFKAKCAACAAKWPNQRNMRRRFASDTAMRLTAPIYRYGRIFNLGEVKKSILAAE